MVVAGCKWCQIGECWTHGGAAKGAAKGVAGPGFTKKGQKGGAKGAAPMAAFVQKPPAVAGKGAAGAAAALGSAGALMGSSGCKWCLQGSCWTHQGAPGPTKAPRRPSDERLAALSVPEATPKEVQLFLETHPGIEPHCVEKLVDTHAKLQKVIIDMGPMSDAKDYTALLMSRIKQVNSIRSGDWVCLGCHDLQFAKNALCRKCGTPKPAAGW
mmetsp:Transcript_23177/g.46964  ORF Transcript_23177/g.46964 Transcript_23177/m.46964 type:complete len:213 (+) Transcript_23177:29-667(+)